MYLLTEDYGKLGPGISRREAYFSNCISQITSGCSSKFVLIRTDRIERVRTDYGWDGRWMVFQIEANRFEEMSTSSKC